jgi:hypothetical protein
MSSLFHRFLQKVPITTFQESKEAGLRQFHFSLPYNMHYWYFNIVNPTQREVFSYILTRTATPHTYANDEVMKTDQGWYYNVCSDFKKKSFFSKNKEVILTKDSIQAEDFLCEMNGKSWIFMFDGKEFVFDELLGDSYYSNLGGMYWWCCMNFRERKTNTYFQFQNVFKRGPIPSMNWLHYYLDDGTYLKTFTTPRIPLTPFRVNNTELHIQSIHEDTEMIRYVTKKDDLFFTIEFEKGYHVDFNYTPPFSPTWHYIQYSPKIKRIETNLPKINASQKGSGILELDRGWSF